jgi:hypothetical protein
MAQLRITQWNADRLLARVPQILEEFGPQVAFQSEQELAKIQYEWPRTRSDGTRIITYRKNGQQVTSPRDIVDTGTLMNSATPPQVSSAGSVSKLQIQWMAPYAEAVRAGGYLIGTVRANYVAPSRDWIQKTYVQLRPEGERPFLPFLVRRWNQLAQRR